MARKVYSDIPQTKTRTNRVAMFPWSSEAVSKTKQFLFPAGKKEVPFPRVPGSFLGLSRWSTQGKADDKCIMLLSFGFTPQKSRTFLCDLSQIPFTGSPWENIVVECMPDFRYETVHCVKSGWLKISRIRGKKFKIEFFHILLREPFGKLFDDSN